MTASYHDIRQWDAEALEGSANTIRAGKDRLLGLEDELLGSFGPWLWHGEAAEAARERLGRLRDRAEHVVAEASAVQRALYAASDAVAELKVLVDETDTLAQRHQFGIAPDGSLRNNAPESGSPRSRFEAEEQAAYRQARAEVAVRLRTSVTQIMTTANDIDNALAGVMAQAEAGAISDQGATSLTEADLTRQTGDGHYRIGPPDRPDITFDEDFVYDSKDAGWRDQLKKLEWLGKLRAAQLLGRMPDATEMYEHYWSNTGDPKEFDYEKAYRQDSGIRAGVDAEIARAASAAEELVRAGHTGFPMTGDASIVAEGYYPQTENWQKAVGGYQVWSHSNVRVDGNTVTMEITVEAEDRYNFNRGQSDIATGTSDEENGRFTEIGWARPFDVHGEMTRTITWELGDPPQEPPPPSGGDDEPRGRDRERGSTPDNPRQRGR